MSAYQQAFYSDGSFTQAMLYGEDSPRPTCPGEGQAGGLSGAGRERSLARSVPK